MTEIYRLASFGTPVLIIEGHSAGITFAHSPEPDAVLFKSAVADLHAALGHWLEENDEA